MIILLCYDVYIYIYMCTWFSLRITCYFEPLRGLWRGRIVYMYFWVLDMYVSLALYSYFCHLMFSSYGFFSTQVNSFLERCVFILRFLFPLFFKAPSIL
ncbi:uncharacterized protein DS421_17g571780 [Arachis hypogaea]|nr:uncharacterized protein DS421_17g571780 [Arachis hypogaea]